MAATRECDLVVILFFIQPQVQYWVATEILLTPQLNKRVYLLRKFIKIAAQYVLVTSIEVEMRFSFVCFLLFCFYFCFRCLISSCSKQVSVCREIYSYSRGVCTVFFFFIFCLTLNVSQLTPQPTKRTSLCQMFTFPSFEWFISYKLVRLFWSWAAEWRKMKQFELSIFPISLTVFSRMV